MNNRKENFARARNRYTNYKVTESAELMDFLSQKMPEASRTTLKNLLSKRLVYINRIITTQYNHPLEPGMMVQISQDKDRKPFRSKYIDIVHEDAYFIIIDKFSNTPSSPIRGREAKSSALYILENYIRQYHNRRKIYPIYKMEEDFSGLMIYAKDEHTKDSFDESWSQLVKEYVFAAICDGKPKQNSGTITSWVIDGQVYYSHTPMSSEEIDKATTKYRFIKELPNNQSLVEFSPADPSRNQMKLHAKELGCPIVGDKKYNTNSKAKKLAAHAYKLVFNHPVTRELIKLELPLPNHIQALL